MSTTCVLLFGHGILFQVGLDAALEGGYLVAALGQHEAGGGAGYALVAVEDQVFS